MDLKLVERFSGSWWDDYQGNRLKLEILKEPSPRDEIQTVRMTC